MTTEVIAKFLETDSNPTSKSVKIDFKKRNSLIGVFVKGTDYADLKSKNFWRIVTAPNIEEWQKSRNMGLAKIFSGSEMTKLSEVNEKKVAKAV
jgi:hypothetical protein